MNTKETEDDSCTKVTDEESLSTLMENWTDFVPNPSPMERDLMQSLDRLTHRLANKDPHVTHLEPWLGPYADLWLDFGSVQEAFDRCVEMARHSSTVESVKLKSLPERELKFAIMRLPKNTLSLNVEKTSRSQSLPYSIFEGIPTSIRTLRVDTRISVKSSQQVVRLALSLSKLTSLEVLQLHILPRCSFQDPRIDLGPLFTALSGLRILEVTAGYDHNHYHKPLFSADALRQLLDKNPNLETLRLDNLGLRNEHLVTIVKGAPTTLHHLHIAKNHPTHTAFSKSSLDLLCAMAHLESCVIWTPDECRRLSSHDEAVLCQEHLHMWCLLRRYQRHGSKELLQLLDEDDSCRYVTGALYSILRSNPAVAMKKNH